MLHYRRHEVRLAAGHGLAAPLLRVFELLDYAGVADVRVRLFFEDAPGSASACERIVARFPECSRLAPPRPARPVAFRLMALSNCVVDVRSWFAGRILPVTETIAERWAIWPRRQDNVGSRWRLWTASWPLNTA